MEKIVDTDRLKKIMTNYETDPNFTLLLLEEYLIEYPNDLDAHFSYISLLITIGRFDDANNCINFIAQSFENDKVYHRIIYLKLRILMYSGNFEESYKLIKDNKNLLKILSPKIDYYEIYCEQQLKKNKNRNDYNKYLLKQFVEYKKADFINYSKIFMDGVGNTKYIFLKDFDYQKVLTELEQYIPSNNCLHKGFIEDDYYFRYEKCGIVDGKQTDFFKIIVLHDTNNIIAMYPVSDASNLLYIDLNFLRQEENAPMKRRLSQIDKFNKKNGKEMH